MDQPRCLRVGQPADGRGHRHPTAPARRAHGTHPHRGVRSQPAEPDRRREGDRMTTSDRSPVPQAGPPTADAVRRVHSTTASMLRSGYTAREVDQFVARAADELARLTEENAQLREEVQHLRQQVEAAAARPSPSEQAVGILATAQLTADQYVAEAEDFSRQMTSEARTQYEELLSEARERAGAIVQAAAEARAAIAGAGRAGNTDGPDTQELQDQIAYLKAFGQAVRTQL